MSCNGCNVGGLFYGLVLPCTEWCGLAGIAALVS